MIPGVLSDEECFTEESHYASLLEYPQYTRPAVWEGRAVPDVLLTGHHANIAAWRREQSLLRTLRHRPDMLEKAELSPKELYALTNGPGKLCVAMSIDRSLDRRNMVLVNSGNERIAESDFFVRDDGYRAAEIVRAPRIGIDYAGEAAEYPWRFTAKEKNGVPMLEKDGCSVIF
jgi:3-methyladenine DNA glycosylase Mpg